MTDREELLSKIDDFTINLIYSQYQDRTSSGESSNRKLLIFYTNKVRRREQFKQYVAEFDGRDPLDPCHHFELKLGLDFANL